MPDLWFLVEIDKISEEDMMALVVVKLMRVGWLQ